jgi:glutathione synthase/RimK-type ligase-like ATP-grasp enzyme
VNSQSIHPASAARTIAFVTHAASPALTADDQFAADALAAAGVRVQPVPWDDPHASWDAYDGVVLRSCWDYHLRHAEFCAWVRAADAQGAGLRNPAAAVLWNADKRYLREMERHGTPIVPTAWVEPGEIVELDALLDERGWERAVVKPSVSASAHQTRVVARGSAEGHAAGLDGSALLVQPFVDEVVTNGEWSIIFFGGRFSHAVLKLPRDGDFRVQAEFGGRAVPRIPPPELVDAAAGAVRAAEALTGIRLTFARVDGVVADGRFLLMELELIEPALFLSTHPDAPSRFAAAILEA